MMSTKCSTCMPFIKIILTNSWKVCWCPFPCQSNLLGKAWKKLRCYVTRNPTVARPLFTFRVVDLYICNVLTDGNHVQTMRSLHYKHSWTSNSMLTFEFSSSRFNTCNIMQKIVNASKRNLILHTFLQVYLHLQFPDMDQQPKILRSGNTVLQVEWTPLHTTHITVSF